MKTSELTGVALDWAVFKIEGYGWYEINNDGYLYAPLSEKRYSPSTDWQQGGPIIEREWLDITPWPNESDEGRRWMCQQHDMKDCVYFGSTPLIAAMRCYVASKFGDEVYVPDELKGE